MFYVDTYITEPVKTFCSLFFKLFSEWYISERLYKMIYNGKREDSS